MNLLIIIFKTLFFYFLVLFSYKLMGKREIAKLGIIDLIVSILIAELIAISIENRSDPIIYSLIPILVLVLLEISFAYISLKNRKFRTFFDGRPSLIIANGKVNYHEMVRLRYSLDDLLLSLRQSGIKDISEVEYAFLEVNGKLSIFKYNFLNKSRVYPMPLILDGVIEDNTLKFIHKDRDWLLYKLQEENLSLQDVFYCFYKSKKLYIINKTKIKK
jgi:uncharacterized membrane protein YcaP (DUF421 family)